LVGGLGGVSGLESGLLIWVLCPLSGGVLGGQSGAFLTWREGSGRRLECLWGVVGLAAVLWAGAVKVVRMQSPTSQELFGVVACC
jgi:hypothetical protein